MNAKSNDTDPVADSAQVAQLAAMLGPPLIMLLTAHIKRIVEAAVAEVHESAVEVTKRGTIMTPDGPQQINVQEVHRRIGKETPK